jgi:prepilin-type N-terminal cleavage/methylation domain-containing protein
MTRRGFTLVELLIAMIVSAIVGSALVRLTIGQARFMGQQEAWRSARSVSRSGINRLASDIRAVENGSQVALGGLQAAVAGGQDFTLRVPYAFGIVCFAQINTATVSLLPVDSAMYFAPGYSGFAVRSSAGAYTYYTPTVANIAPTLGAGTIAQCTGPALPDQPINAATGGALPSINGSPAGRVVGLIATTNPLNPMPAKGSIVFLYRRIRYEFKASVAIPGRTGLWRTLLDGGGFTEEIAAPFANTARVNFFVLNNAAAQAAVPANLYNVRGLELVLNGQSENTPAGSAAPKTANVTTSVFFENRPD